MNKPSMPAAIALLSIFALALSGCATDALKLAPDAPDQPWKDGESKNAPANTTSQTKDFSVPSNPELALISSPVAVDTRSSYDLAQLIDLAQQLQGSDLFVRARCVAQ